MPFIIDWYLENRIIYWKESGILTPADLHGENEILFTELANYADDSLHLLMDTLELEHRPPDIGAIRQTLDIFAHSSIICSVIIGPPDPARRFLVETVQRFSPAKIAICDNLDAALAFLLQVDPDLAALI